VERAVSGGLPPVLPGAPVDLAALPTGDDGGMSREEGRARLEEVTAELGALQEELYAAGTHALLVVLQGMDTSGKDGTIRAVMSGVSPVGCRVASFRVPTPDELARDFLWRVHREVPAKGMMAVFNRSHYEDVLVVRVQELVPEAVWRPRYEQIRRFEALLADTGTLLLKFFLHISPEEQEERLLAREADPTKAWKLSAGDWRERERWDAYQRAYAEAIEETSTEEAPWHVVPADRKWYRNLRVAETIVRSLREHRGAWADRLERMAAAGREEVRAFREGGPPQPLA
jgi:PPK2 family polyphosphate:nucleotide phosphotransferase